MYEPKDYASLAEENRRLRIENDDLRSRLDAIKFKMYGMGYQIVGFHLNGEAEPLDNLIEDDLL